MITKWTVNTEFKDGLIDAMNNSIPSKLITMITKGKQSPWITDDIKILYKRKQRALTPIRKPRVLKIVRNFRPSGRKSQGNPEEVTMVTEAT